MAANTFTMAAAQAALDREMERGLKKSRELAGAAGGGGDGGIKLFKT